MLTWSINARVLLPYGPCIPQDAWVISLTIYIYLLVGLMSARSSVLSGYPGTSMKLKRLLQLSLTLYVTTYGSLECDLIAVHTHRALRAEESI